MLAPISKMLPQEILDAGVAAHQAAERRAAKKAGQAHLKARLALMAEDIKQYERARIVEFQRQHDVKVGKSRKAGAYFIKAFVGSSKVPLEMVQLLLRDKTLWPMRVAERHKLLVPKVLRSLGVDQSEDISVSIWNRPLEAYQLGPIRQAVISHGYTPTDEHRTVAHFLKLVQAGKEQSRPTGKPTSIGQGDKRVSF